MASIIDNPNQQTALLRAQFPEIVNGEPDDDLLNMSKRQGRVRVKRMMAAKYVDPARFDREFESVIKEVKTEVVEIDAKLMEGTRVVHYRSAKEFLRSPSVRQRIETALKHRKLLRLSESDADKASEMLRKRSVQVRMQARLKEGSDFEYGLYPDEVTGGMTKKVFPISDIALPSLNSPHSKQQLLIDYLDSHRKCLSGNTLIQLLDGTSRTLRELTEQGGEFWVYACRDGMVYPAKAQSARITGHRPVFDVVLDNGEVVRATGCHPFMLRDGSYRPVSDLKAGDRLMPFYHRLSRTSRQDAYHQVYHPALDLWEYTHHMVARVEHAEVFFHFDEKDRADRHIHHVNEDRLDNQPGNLQVLHGLLHLKHHVNSAAHRERTRQQFLGKPKPASMRRAISKANKRTWADPAVRARRLAGIQSEETKAKVSAASLRYWQGLSEPERAARSQRLWDKRRANAANHTVTTILPAGSETVYDLTVPGFENFAVGKQGVFVHNSFDAATFNPIAKRIIRLVGQFVLGRGVKGAIGDREHQAAWDDFWKRNKMKLRTKQTLRELLIYGEFFWRYFQTPAGLVVRSIDPSTIWDIVTDEDDLEEVKYYHQQYVRLDISPIPGRVALPSTLVIRQIPAAEVSHYKINSTSSEKRGRSELFPILGYLLRFKEYVNDRILLNKMRAMFALDVSVEGGETDVAAAEEQFSEPPGPAAVLVHNKAVEVEFKNANTNAGDAATDADTILKVIAIGAGISEQFLGVSRAQTRAGALISTEPDVKNFEEYQELMEEVLIDASDRVFAAKRLPLAVMEFTFPSIAQEDRSVKLKDVAFCESMDYFSKERAATMAAREFQLSDYHYSKEQQAIRQERAGDPVVSATMQQVPKIAPAEPGGETPGLGTDLKPQRKVTQTSGQMGFSDRIGGRALSDTQATLNRGGFTRGGEKTAIRNNRTSGTPLRHANVAGTLVPRKPGWSDTARAKSLATRRAHAQKRRQPP